MSPGIWACAERCFRSFGHALVIVYAVLPVAWLAALSLKPAAALDDGRLIPRSLTLEHYRAIFVDAQFPYALWNSLGIALLATLLAVPIAALAAYFEGLE